ncbi:MAG: hypothetical protein JO061_24365, partial [Acidobacteriaceae bacterium]|nr:hypothetical protein [Acidobacteriaceae bacterium]
MPGPRSRKSRNRRLGVFRALLRLYPSEFRKEHGREMTIAFSDRCRDAGTIFERSLTSMQAVAGILLHAPKEHFSMITLDLRYALRLLRNAPVFAFTAILSLAIGIGANTAIFVVARKVLFDSLPVKNPEQLRMLTWVSGHEQPVPPVWGDVYATKAGGLESTSFSYPVLQELQKSTSVFEDLIAFKDVEMTATVDGHPKLIPIEMLSGNAF